MDAGKLVSVVLEVLDGRRPVRLLRELAVAGLAARLAERVRAGSSSRLVRAPRVCHPSRFVAEVSATVRRGGRAGGRSGGQRVVAVAARVEHRGGRWWFTSFSVLG